MSKGFQIGDWVESILNYSNLGVGHITKGKRYKILDTWRKYHGGMVLIKDDKGNRSKATTDVFIPAKIEPGDIVECVLDFKISIQDCPDVLLTEGLWYEVVKVSRIGGNTYLNILDNTVSIYNADKFKLVMPREYRRITEIKEMEEMYTELKKEDVVYDGKCDECSHFNVCSIKNQREETKKRIEELITKKGSFSDEFQLSFRCAEFQINKTTRG